MTTDNNNPMDAINTTDGNAERLSTLKSLYPDLFTNEGKLSINELQKLADPNSVNETERFEFKWFGKSQAKRNAFSPTNATLVFDEARSINPQSSQHIIIEGENLEVLKLLKEGYREKIKCIYIDPPYNTGKDFVYSDNFTQDKRAYWQDNGTVDAGVKVDTNSESDGRYHSHWLNMMFSRLLLARELLRDDGVIFISIDDNEVHHLRKLCDEVFGESNFVASITRATGTPTGGGGLSAIVNEIDYMLIYSKQCGIKFSGTELDPEESAIYDKEDEHGQFLTRTLRRTGGEDRREDRPTMFYPITAPDGTDIYPISPSGYESRWRCGKDKFNKLLKTNLVEWKVSDNIWTVYQKFYIEGRLKQAGNLWNKIEGNKKATKDVKDLFNGNKIFDFPKPIEFISKILEICTSEDDIIIDFFGGSGTTGHAVMELNKADGGNRQFILVQIPEQTDEASEAYKAGYKKISDITIARNQKVVEKLQAEGVETGFKVFKLAMSNFPRAMFELDPGLDDAGNLQRLQQYINEKERQLFNTFDEANLLTEILIKRGFNLNYQTNRAEKFAKIRCFG